MRNKTIPVVIGTVVILALMVAASMGILFLNSPVAQAETVAQAEASALPRTITVVGEGRVQSAPDIAQINIGIETIGPDVKQASADATTAMDQLLTTLEAQGVATADIQTSYFNVWVDRPYSPEGLPSQDPIYHVNNTVAITVRDLDQVGTTLGAAIDAGANSVNGITFNISEPDELRSDARQAATEDALAKAQELATLQGVEIGDVVTVSEVIGGTGPIFDSSQVAFAEGIGGGGVGPISPGEVEIVVRLQVTYQIK